MAKAPSKAPPKAPTKAPSVPMYARQVPPGAANGLTSAEWLLTDGAGGFAMGTVAGAPTRRYHAWLIAATAPPVGRISLLSTCAEWLVESPGTSNERRHDLSTFLFPDSRSPRGEDFLVRFEAGASARWTYEVPTSAGTTRVTRELILHRAADEAHSEKRAACTVRYTIENAPPGSHLLVRPLVSMRDFHGLLRGRGCEDRFVVSDALSPKGAATGSEIAINVAPHYGPLGPGTGNAANPTLNVAFSGAKFIHDRQWWFDFDYPIEASRGQECREDLFSPGAFTANVSPNPGLPVELELTAWTGTPDRPRESARALMSNESTRIGTIISKSLADAAASSEGSDLSIAISRLAAASDRYIVKRDLGTRPRDAAAAPSTSVSIIAGYPWFSDWGRDTMICLPGLLLATGRFDEARKTLETFARLRKDGLIPNWFDNAGNAEYNTIDAPLWFIHAACRYAEVIKQPEIFDGEVGHACLDIVAAYRAGTRYGIRMDDDGLITGGDSNTQLTWMDAKRDGVIFTPRYGKAVEVNALWYNALRSLAGALDETRPEDTDDLNDTADRVAASFQQKFWNPLSGCLYDVLVPDQAASHGWRPDARTRPNQIFAASLPHSALTQDQRASVIECVRRRLLTPFGLRTLFPGDPGYIGRFRGNLFERDRAYHNGTVWPWLLGPFAEATMRSAHFSDESRRAAFELLRPLLGELDSHQPGRLLGQLPEVYDGDDRPDEPRQPGGCPAQAWSVAETLRVLAIIQQP